MNWFLSWPFWSIQKVSRLVEPQTNSIRYTAFLQFWVLNVFVRELCALYTIQLCAKDSVTQPHLKAVTQICWKPMLLRFKFREFDPKRGYEWGRDGERDWEREQKLYYRNSFSTLNKGPCHPEKNLNIVLNSKFHTSSSKLLFETHKFKVVIYSRCRVQILSLWSTTNVHKEIHKKITDLILFIWIANWYRL